MFLMILIGIIAGLFIRLIFPGINKWLYSLVRILLIPLVMGIGYEIIMIAGKHDNIVTRVISAPGLWVQRITTKEPTLDMLEVAIVSIKCALRDDFPEFKEFFDSEGWRSEEEKAKDAEALKEAENTDKAADVGGSPEVEVSAESQDSESPVNTEAAATEEITGAAPEAQAPTEKDENEA